MVLFDLERKEEFTVTTQVQNLGRLLTRTGREAHDVIREFANEIAQTAETVKVSEARTLLWERIRTLREVFLKCLVLLQLKDYLPAINEAVQIGASIWDSRETVRRRAQEFYEIQWPPLGAFPPPVPPPAVEAATDVLNRKKASGLPAYTQLAVEQTGCSPLECVKQLKLSAATRKDIEHRLTSAILADYALAISKSSRMGKNLNFVSFKLSSGRIKLCAEGEFELAFISDFRRFQFERCRFFVGETIGYGSTFDLEVAGCNTLQSACNVVIDTFGALRRRAVYEVNTWKALMNASKETRERCRQCAALYQWLESRDLLDPKKPIEVNKLLEEIAEDLFQEVIEAGKKEPEEAPTEDTETKPSEKADEEAQADMMEEKNSVEGEVEPPKATSVNIAEDPRPFKEITDELYDRLTKLEYKCAARLELERDRYRKLDDNLFSFEFYRFIIRLAARMSRYIAWLMLREQARCIRESRLPPAGLFHVQETKRQRSTRRGGGGTRGGDQTSSVGGSNPAWRSLFVEYFPDPPNEPSIFSHLPGAEDMPFAALLPADVFPLHAEMLDIDILPALPLSLFERVLKRSEKNDAGSRRRGSIATLNSADGTEGVSGSNRQPPICRLTFTIDHYLAELSVELWPLQKIVQAYEALTDDEPADAEAARTDTLLRQLVESLSELPSLQAFYAFERPITQPRLGGPRFRQASSSEVRRFTPEALNLTTWLSRSFRVIASMTLRTLAMELQFAEALCDLWAFEILENVSESAKKDYRKDQDATLLRISFHDRLMFSIWIDFLTGQLCLDASHFGGWLQKYRLDVSQASAYVSHLQNRLAAGEIPKILKSLQALEKVLQQSTADPTSTTADQIVTILSDDEEERPKPKKHKSAAPEI